MSIEPFEIPSIPSERLALLKQKLQNAEYPNELEKDAGWTYGAPRWAVEPLVKAWLNEYDWEKARAEMNQWHHYQVTIQGLRVHFIHEPSDSPDAIPLLLLNGWPSNFYEYHKVIQPLRDGANGGQAFHVVIPSLPGYGFSEAPKLPGHGVGKNAEIMDDLMTTIGYNEYFVHGSDWGSMIGKWMAMERSVHCKGYHTVMPLCSPPLPTPSFLFSHPVKVAKFLASIALGFGPVYGQGVVKLKGKSFADVQNDRDAGYRAIQATRPYTLAYGLTDSPVGLLAWMLEKFHNWTYHPSGNVETQALPETVTTEEFLTQVTIYWLTNTMSSSTRLYYEAFNEAGMKRVFMGSVTIPMAVAYFPGELTKFPREWLEATGNLVQYNEQNVGGHFPALEVSDVLVDDVQRFGKSLKANKHL
ncbi:Alpha/Beta hydrolase protein [Zychaea mexicana]|uniref:Alpha/Beta hydrolase protein n=1 Tax=Zychaea mexicana TaxID=64656 RepID=UPI0022FE4B76|nr:Alpha/Beta hydrolase protein [Zychaea mexicana]KAI9493081.1 Alpha/Beta hydrolase protein [Zychaea mexicana]